MKILLLAILLVFGCQNGPTVKSPEQSEDKIAPSAPKIEKDMVQYPKLFINAEQEELDFYNAREEAIRASEASAIMTPKSFIIALLGPPEEGVTRSIFASEEKNLEVLSGEKVIIVKEENIPDDSIGSEIRFFTLRKPEKSWQLVAVSGVWKCHSGRGHQNFSTLACN